MNKKTFVIALKILATNFNLTLDLKDKEDKA